MKHITTIEILIQTLIQSEAFHALVVQSPPGWSKSTTIDSALRKLRVPFVSMGSYTTGLHFFNTLVCNPTTLVLLDDCAGLFSDAKTMAILKAATWSSGGPATGAGPTQSRRVTWGSTSEKVIAPFVDFSGKIILLTNVLPQAKEVQAFLTRCLSYPIAFTENDIKRMILEAATSREHFDSVALAAQVAQYIVSEAGQIDYSQVNLRTLRMGYELAKTQPKTWKTIIPYLLPKKPGDVIAQAAAEIINPLLSPKLQEVEFCTRTGKGRRTFYLYKRKLGLSRPYKAKNSRSKRRTKSSA